MKRMWQILTALAVAGFAGMMAVSVLASPPKRPTIAVDTATAGPVSVSRLPGAITLPWPRPTAVLVTFDGEKWHAFSNRSTHRGCVVEPTPDKKALVDVCYGSVWNLKGQPIAGPAPRGLDWYEFTQFPDGWLEVDLSRQYLGEER